MDKEGIKRFLEFFEYKKGRTIVIVDYGNVDNWRNSLGWTVDIQKLAILIKNISFGNQFLRRFYYGADYGPNENRVVITQWSRSVLERAVMNRFEVIKKRVKYIHSQNGFEKKCDLDVEMTVDLIKERDKYDIVVIFSGDGDLMYAVKYLHDEYQKKCFVFSARGHVGREVIDAAKTGFVEGILYAEDFEYRLNKKRFF